MVDLAFHNEAESQVSVDDAILLIRGQGKFSLQGSCETPFRQSGYPDSVEIDIQLPVSELGGTPMQGTLQLHVADQSGGWPLP